MSNTKNTAANINLNIVSASALNPSIQAAMAADSRTRGQYATTTAFTFDGGEALGLVTGEGAFVRTFQIILLGRKVHIVEARGLRQALAQLGR